jgi:GntR family transcriptional regulator
MPSEDCGVNDDPRAYIRMAGLIRQQIVNGKLKPGDSSPSISTLVQEHGHARQTCSKAFKLLMDEGLLFRVPGLGYFVSNSLVE